MLGHYNKEFYRSCQHCRCVIEIKKGFKEDPSVFNECFKLLQNQDRINPQIHIIWTENKKYGAFTNFHRPFLDKIFRMENIKSKYGEISEETIETYLNSSTWDIKESLWVIIHLHCPIKVLYTVSATVFALRLYYKLPDTLQRATKDLKAHISLKICFIIKKEYLFWLRPHILFPNLALPW